MPKLSLGNAIIAMVIAGAIALIVMLVSSMTSQESGALDSFARGEMRDFRTVSQAPNQPLLTLTTRDGEQLTLGDRRGKILLVNFWATWCAPCVIEMPYLNELQGRYGSDDFEVVTISMDQRFDEAEDFFAENALNNLTLYHDPSVSAAFAAGARGLPLTILYDRNGGEIGRLNGEADWSSQDAHRLIEAALERY